MALEQAKPVKDFEIALRRLGWLSAYSRQILLARHLLRNFSAISHPDNIPALVPGEFALDLFRCSITVLSGVNRETLKFSSPYEPSNRPETHHLGYRRKKRIFSASIASGMPEIHYHFDAGGGFGFENSTEISTEDSLLSFEIQAVAKNVSLVTKALADQRVESLRNEKLWRGLPSQDQTDAAAFFENWHEWAGRNGAFWREWYQGFLDGKPLDWELQSRVALIDNAIWEAGPKAVADEIEKIRAKFYLEKCIDELEIELRSATPNRYGIGGNMPPEHIDDAPIGQELFFVLRPLNDLKDEIAKDNSDPTRIEKIIKALVNALKTGIAWCLRKADLIVDTAIKWAIPAGGTGYFALNPEKLEYVIEAAKKLLEVL